MASVKKNVQRLQKSKKLISSKSIFQDIFLGKIIIFGRQSGFQKISFWKASQNSPKHMHQNLFY